MQVLQDRFMVLALIAGYHAYGRYNTDKGLYRTGGGWQDSTNAGMTMGNFHTGGTAQTADNWGSLK